jgi:hypothetical protein
MAKTLNNYQLACAVVSYGAQKFKQVAVLKRTKARLYRIEKFTDAEYLIFGGGYENAEREDAIEAGGWVLLDAFTASGIKSLYEQLEKAEMKEKVLRLSILQLSAFIFKKR